MVQTKADREKQKLITDKCQALIEVLLKDEDNKYCVDCDAKGPRWASWNLGIFMCIRCAGIHRNLGVHISRVKSVNLDAWTPEHVAHVQRMGNSKARAIYEANLPDDFRRPQTDTALESFIRAKYEHKRYIDQSYVDPGPPEPAFNAEEELKRIKEQKKSKLNSGSNKTMISVSDSFAPAVTASSRHQSSSSISSPSKSRSSSATTTQQPQQSSLLLGNDSFTSGGGASAAAISNMSSNSNTTSTLNSESNKPKSNLADLMDLDLSFGSFNLMPSNMSSFEANPSNPFPALARMNTLNTTATNLNNNLNSILNNSFNMDGAATAAAAAATSPTADNNISQPPMTGNTGKNVFDLLNL